jgi:hypothetical protein
MSDNRYSVYWIVDMKYANPYLSINRGYATDHASLRADAVPRMWSAAASRQDPGPPESPHLADSIAQKDSDLLQVNSRRILYLS